MSKWDAIFAQNWEALVQFGANPEDPVAVYNLAHFLADKFQESGGDTVDINETVSLHRQKLAQHPAGHPDRHMHLLLLAIHLHERYKKQPARRADLDEAISLGRAALELCPEDHPVRSSTFHGLAMFLGDRYDKQGSMEDIEEAITLGRAALELCPPGHLGRAWALHNLARYLRNRSVKLGTNADIEEVISLNRSALELRPTGHPDRPLSLVNLASELSRRYDKQGSIADLEEAITLTRAPLELPLPPADRAVTLDNLGMYLRMKFRKLGGDANIDEAISLHRSALDLRPTGCPERPTSLKNLMECLSSRSEKAETVANLDALIALHQNIFSLYPVGHHDRAASVDKLLFHVRKRAQTLGMNDTLDECIAVAQSALALPETRNPDKSTRMHSLVADLPIGFLKHENVSDVQEAHPDHASILYHLHAYVKDLNDKEEDLDDGDTARNVERIVAIAQAACRLCPPPHIDHVVLLLVTLAIFYRRSFRRQGAIPDLDQAIMLYRELLAACQSEHPTSAQHMHDLAWCLSQRFIRCKPPTPTDLDDAIKFEQTALTLRPQGHSNRDESLCSLADYQQLKIKHRDAVPQPLDGPTSNAMIQTAVGNIVFEVLKPFPPRLIDTQTGILCDRESQVLRFKKSQEYEQLLSSALTLDTLQQTTHIREVVSTYFQYVTLSHRWGALEPLLRDIERRDIYDLGSAAGQRKLSFFCLESLRRGYLWAWSDTCCIDKESSAELQEAIGSMFSWYQRSALTVVHLNDVSATGSLISSEWFKRGWTLQELLAPRSLLFFTQDWSLYRNISSNHKEDNAILEELEQATGIMLQHLTHFHPGVDDARARLRWASTRCTTRQEDIAYSLFGVFGLHLPVMYGESADYSLGRLLAEVISRSGDTSILDWVGKPSAFHSCFPATIVPYQAPQLASVASQDTQNDRWPFSLTSVRHMHQTLSNLAHTQFVNVRLILPCIVYHVKAVKTRANTSSAAHVHRIQATGLEPIEIVLSQPLENVSRKPVPYVLIRPWHSSLLDASVMTNDASAGQWLTRMQQPFSAFLLMGLPQNEYKRVATFCRILARPTNSEGVLSGEVKTLTII